MDFLATYTVPVIVGICLCIGYVLKQWVADLDNKFIPTILAAVGLIFAVWVNGWIFSPEIILQGLFSGLSATGLHQAFKQIVEGGKHE